MKMESAHERPASLYDNLRPGGSLHSSGALSVGNLTTVGTNNSPYHPSVPMDRLKSPSQANCLSTTVPQNIAAPAISGRHTPTRNSLRHSRMIVLSRNGTVPRKYLPPILYHHKLAKGLAGLQTLVGAAVVTVSSWIYIYSPSLSFRDIPFWSGLPLLLSGLLGLLLLCCCRKDYPGYPLSCCVFSFKVTSLTVSVIAGVGCFCAVMFAVIHLLSLQKMVCEAELDVCICRTNNTSYLEERPYPDLSCPEVENMLTLLLVTSASVNCLGGILVAWYLYLHWSSRYSYVYSQVRTNEINRPMVITNKL
ncbi:sarcospan isoform X2 [Homalodisca vitripennis]|uniref:sarcospan isoform X2 n=1 Tax=Homalodisca vitripennis TaxID=197043 RepID=UPI001EE9D600|nr:sarcospan isoform X2 [Homalodisca vitripennis]